MIRKLSFLAAICFPLYFVAITLAYPATLPVTPCSSGCTNIPIANVDGNGNLLVAPAAPVTSSNKYFSAANLNPTNIKASAGSVWFVLPENTTTTVYYLKLYNKATSPSCGTDTPVQTYPIPPAPSSGQVGGVPIAPPSGIYFSTGIGFCITGAMPDNDTTNAATGIVVNFVWQ